MAQSLTWEGKQPLLQPQTSFYLVDAGVKALAKMCLVNVCSIENFLASSPSIKSPMSQQCLRHIVIWHRVVRCCCQQLLLLYVSGVSRNTQFVWINYNSLSLDTSPVPVASSDDRGSNVEDSILKAHCSLFSTTTDDIPTTWYIFTPSIELVPFQQHTNTRFYNIACCMCAERAQTMCLYSCLANACAVCFSHQLASACCIICFSTSAGFVCKNSV